MNKCPDPTPQNMARLLEQRNGVFLITVRGKRIVQVSRCRVPFVSPTTEVVNNQTQFYLQQMLAKRAGVFVAQLAAGAIVGLGTVDAPLEVGHSSPYRNVP